MFTTSMWFALAFLAAFVIGGFSGVITAIVPVDWQLTDTYWVVAHIHYVLIGANVFPVLAAIYYWYPTGMRSRRSVRSCSASASCSR